MQELCSELTNQPISFSPTFSPILDTGLSLVTVIYQLSIAYTCVSIWRGCSVSRIVLADIYSKLL